MAEFSQGLGFNLSDALAGNIERLPNFFECVRASILEAKAHFKHFTLAVTKLTQDVLELFAKHLH